MATDFQEQAIEAFKSLSQADRCSILGAISEIQQTPGISQEKILTLLESTGHLDTAQACYAAFLCGVKFWQ